MSKKAFNPQECIAPLNTIKQAMQMTNKPFDKKSILNSLKGCGLPTNSRFWSVFRDSGVLQEVSKGLFMFSSKEPIFVGTLNRIKEKYLELSHRYRSNSRLKKTKPLEVQKKEGTQYTLLDDNLSAQIQSAIDLLKENGYLIFVPTCVEYTQV